MKNRIKLMASLLCLTLIITSCAEEEKQSLSDSNISATENRKSLNIINARRFVNRVLVEEYSGTWCGNCPNILYGTQLLKQQTNKEVSVQIHRGSDPFVIPDGNTIATQQNVVGVPTGRINRTINWTGPQYQNVNQVLNEIKTSSAVGLAINSTINLNGVLNVNVIIGYINSTIQTKLMVYIVEDNLFHNQANYYSNLYGGLNPIPNFEYDGVLRSVISSTSGDVITVSGNQVQKNYTVALPANVSNVNNAKIVAFLIDTATNSVLNVRQSNVGQSQVLETL